MIEKEEKLLEAVIGKIKKEGKLIFLTTPPNIKESLISKWFKKRKNV